MLSHTHFLPSTGRKAWLGTGTWRGQAMIQGNCRPWGSWRHGPARMGLLSSSCLSSYKHVQSIVLGMNPNRGQQWSLSALYMPGPLQRLGPCSPGEGGDYKRITNTRLECDRIKDPARCVAGSLGTRLQCQGTWALPQSGTSAPPSLAVSPWASC